MLANNINNKIRHSIIVETKGNLPQLTTVLSKLVKSVNAKKTEIIVVDQSPLVPTGPDEKLYPINVLLRSYCEPESIAYQYIRDEVNATNLARAWNTGAKDPRGEYLVFMRDGVVPSDNFLEKLTYCFENFSGKYRIGNVGVVGPALNHAVRRQQIKVPLDRARPECIDELQADLGGEVTKKYKTMPPWIIMGELTAACLLTTVKIFQEVGLFNERQMVNHGDAHDWFTRVMDKGYFVTATSDVICFRYNDVDDSLKLGHERLNRHNRYYPALTPERLGIIYRAKIRDDSEMQNFVKSLQKSVTLSDYIFILDDNSRIGVKRILQEKYPDLWARVTKLEKYSRSTDYARDYNELLDWARSAGITWVLALRTDEVVESRINKDFLHRLMQPVDPQIRGYLMSIYLMWNDDQNWRSDGVIGQLADIRLFRLNGWFSTNDPADNNLFQCRVPIIPPECVAMSSLRLQHFGYVTPQQRSAQLEYLCQVGVDKKTDAAEYPYYNALGSAHGITFGTWTDDCGLSVYSPVKEGKELMTCWFENVWAFADEIVLGDDGMDMDDHRIAKRWGAKVVPTSMKDDYSAGRNAIVRQCTQSYILQLDLDERLNEWNAVRRMMDVSCTSWEFNIDNLQKDGTSIMTSTSRLFKNDGKVSYWGLLHETIDNYVREANWRVRIAPIKLLHYGYVLTTPQQAWRKMQRYMDLNIEQIKKHPFDARAYYNLALHLLEDNLVADADRLLRIACGLPPAFPLPHIELGKTRIVQAAACFSSANEMTPPGHMTKSYTEQMMAALKQIYPIHIAAAKGHALAYFQVKPEVLQLLADHCLKMEERLEEEKARRMEQVLLR